MNRLPHVRLLSLVSLVAMTACSSGDEASGLRTGGDFVVLKTEPSNNATLYLNDPIRIDFSNAVDLGSVNLSTFSFEVRDQIGNQVAEPVAGNFSLTASPGDANVGRRLLFTPRLPTNDLYTNGGFRPGRTYIVQLVGGNRVNGTVLRDAGGKPLALPVSFRFNTADGATPGQLFRNTAGGGPRRVGFELSPQPDLVGPEAGRVVLNRLGSPDLEIRLLFDQPLNPNSANVPVAIDTSPLTRNPANRGRIFLEYDDVTLGDNVWIPADVELERNAIDGSTVVLRPLGVLPNNATVRVVVERTLEDISGESNVSNAAYDRVFGEFRTRKAYDQQFDALVDDFLASAEIDLSAAFPEPVAEVGPGWVRGGFAFEGSNTGAEFEPVPPETVLNTNFTQVTPKNGAAYNVSGGVFNFRNVKIPAGKIVRGQGSNPMVFLVSGTFEVLGTLSVRGGNGTGVTSSSNANIPKAGGAGVCGGGDGGAGSPSTSLRDIAGGAGNGPLQVSGGGGRGGSLACTAGCGRAAGGGGGALATQGDPNFKQKSQAPNPPATTFTVFQQQIGVGGNGCTGTAGTVTRSLQGADPGAAVFTDSRLDNNYWGVGVRFDGKPLRITGELAVPMGGGGGGGGGDLSYNSSCTTDDVNFENDSSGGGGGGGGGVLIVKALGPIIVGEGGRIVADGGSGGGGEQSASSNKGGGGGGGAGGMVVLMSATRIDINVRGAGSNYRYASPENNYDFSISADGGVCVNAAFGGGPAIPTKYATSGGQLLANYATTYDSAPLGGFGGMGIVQLMAPPGVPGTNVDGTNTILDDNIFVYQGGVLQSGAGALGLRKQALLAWRGFPNQLGQGVDDNGAVINIGDNEGDIRPSPVLLPTPFAAKSRLRSRWIDTGATNRRSLQIDDNSARALLDLNGTLRGPRYEFGGVDPATGYASFFLNGTTALSDFATVVTATTIQSIDTDEAFQGQPAYRVVLAQPVLGSLADRYAQYEADVLAGNDALLASFRIWSHDDNELVLAAESGAFPATAAKLRVRAKFFDLVTNGVAGPGGTYLGSTGTRVPVANVRIGFAFHQDPANPAAQRFPSNPNQFAYNLGDPAVQEQIRALGASFVQWDLLFDRAFRQLPGDQPPALSPDTPRPELRFLRLPYRF